MNLKDNLQEAAGKVQKKFGDATGNEDAQEAGQQNETEGKLGQVTEGAQEKVKGAVEGVRNKLSGDNE